MSTREELLERVESLLPKIAARSGYVAEHGVLHPDTINELDEAEILRTLIPKEYGGFELNIDTLSDISRLLSRSCMSTGWVMAFFVGHNWMVTRFGKKTQDEVFSDNPSPKVPGQIKPTVTAKRVKGGFELTGRSSWNSGIMHADWVLTGIAIDGEAPKLALVRAGDYEVDVVWDMCAMEGTGSNDMICDGTFVPEHRTMEVPAFVEGRTEGNRRYSNPLYSMPVMPFIYAEVMGVLVGGLEGAAQRYIEMLNGRDPAYSPGKLSEMPTVHVKMGDAVSRVNAAGKLLHSLVQETIELQNTRGITMDDRLRLKLDAGYIANHCRESVNALIHDSGGQSFQRKSPIQSHFRDINALSVHAFWDWYVCREQFGRGQVGLEPSHPLI
jgi:3-hydroxy-9,10-secoandrosta-1,3,5(10)-triene-9,17-dione monooxygenase